MRNKIIKFEDVKDKKYNYLTVLREDLPFINKKGNKLRRWVFKCVCGIEKSLSPSNVFSGNVKSCGCKKKQITKKAFHIIVSTLNRMSLKSNR